MFLQETHSSVETEKQWNDEFKGQLYFYHRKTNTGFYGKINAVFKKQLNEENRRILILEVTIDDPEYLLIKGTVMQIEKALIDNRLRFSKASWKFRIPTIYNFAVIYPWNLLYS